jgi:hypothetical protein
MLPENVTPPILIALCTGAALSIVVCPVLIEEGVTGAVLSDVCWDLARTGPKQIASPASKQLAKLEAFTFDAPFEALRTIGLEL